MKYIMKKLLVTSACSFVIILAVHITLFFYPVACYGANNDPCEKFHTSLLVDTNNHKMWLCQANRSVGEFEVALGRGGVDKHKRGDKKTPLGEYALGTPRPSDRFNTFIPVSYPTQEQVSNGYSGSAIGIHGPLRTFRRFGSMTTRYNWTSGCIAVGTDEDISEIAQWIKEQKVSKIFIQ
jgi:murein L,D-transpeptidase YafK